MPFFRKSPDLSRATIRPTCADDLTAASRLLRDGRYRFLAYEAGLLPDLLSSAPGAVLVAEDRTLLGLALLSWPLAGTGWLRAAALASSAETPAALDRLFAPLHQAARAAGLGQVYHSGDLIVDGWLHGVLTRCGYRPHNEVVVYEKLRMDVPALRPSAVRIRRAAGPDLADVLRVDAASFAPQWVKDRVVIGPALGSVPCFVVAELGGAVVGYAFATSHFEGRLVHLVRIAVDPAARGQGAGEQLLAAVVGFAVTSGATTLTLNTQGDNLTAQRLYERFGFRRTGERQIVLLRDLEAGDSPDLHPGG